MLPKMRKQPSASTLLARKYPYRQKHMVSESHNISGLTLPQLKALPDEVLRLHLSSQNRVTPGSVMVMASQHHSMLQHSLPSPSNTTLYPQTPPLTPLQQSVKDFVNKSLEGLRGQLLESIQGMLQTPSSASTDPGSTPWTTSQTVISESFSWLLTHFNFYTKWKQAKHT